MNGPSSDDYGDAGFDYEAAVEYLETTAKVARSTTPPGGVATGEAGYLKAGAALPADNSTEKESSSPRRTSVAAILRNRQSGNMADSRRGRLSTDNRSGFRGKDLANLGVGVEKSSGRGIELSSLESAKVSDQSKLNDGRPSSSKPRANTTEPNGLGNMLIERKPEARELEPPSSANLHAFGISSSSKGKHKPEHDPDDYEVMMPGMGGYMQARIGREKRLKMSVKGYRPESGTMEFKSDKDINRHLLATLGKETNPITNSDLYSRTAHVISAATGHQVSQRGAAKFSMPEKTYMERRNAKLKEQFTARRDEKAAAENASVKERNERPGSSQVAEGAVGKGEAFGDWIVGGARPKRVGIGDLESDLFAGCTIYINGYTGPRISDLELKRLIAIHGGNVSYHCTSACTHILVTSGLSGSKSQKFLDSSSSLRGGKRKVVHVDWVLDSIAQGRKLSETNYNVIVNKKQPTLFSSLEKKPPPPSGSAHDDDNPALRNRHSRVLAAREAVVVVLDEDESSSD